MTVLQFRPRIHLSEPLDMRQMPRWWRDIAAYLTALGYERPHTAVSDLALISALLMGRKLVDISAARGGVSATALYKRWNDLTAAVRDERGDLTIDGQERLLKVLRHRAGV